MERPPLPFGDCTTVVLWSPYWIGRIRRAIAAGWPPLERVALDFLFDEPTSQHGEQWIAATLPHRLFAVVAEHYLAGEGQWTLEGLVKRQLRQAWKGFPDDAAPEGPGYPLYVSETFPAVGNEAIGIVRARGATGDPDKIDRLADERAATVHAQPCGLARSCAAELVKALRYMAQTYRDGAG